MMPLPARWREYVDGCVNDDLQVAILKIFRWHDDKWLGVGGVYVELFLAGYNWDSGLVYGALKAMSPGELGASLCRKKSRDTGNVIYSPTDAGRAWLARRRWRWWWWDLKDKFRYRQNNRHGLPTWTYTGEGEL